MFTDAFSWQWVMSEKIFDRQFTFSLSWEFHSSSTPDKFSQKGADGGTWQIHSSQVFPKWVGGTWTIYPLMIELISLAFLYCPIRIRDQGCENQNPVIYFKTYFIKQKNGACDIGSQEVNIQQHKNYQKIYLLNFYWYAQKTIWHLLKAARVNFES